MLIDESGYPVDYKELSGDIVFYGASTRNQKVIDELDIADRVLFFADIDSKKKGQKLGDYQIESIDTLAKTGDITVISVLAEYMQEVLETLHNAGQKCIFYIFERFDIAAAVKSNHRILSLNKSYKYMHFFPYQKFLKPFYEMLENEMNIAEHLFIVAIGMEDKYHIFEYIKQKSVEYDNILIFDDVHNISHIAKEDINCNNIFEDMMFKNIMQSAEKVMLHSLMFERPIINKLGEWADVYGGKMAWICWGWDSHYSEDEYAVQHILKKLKYHYAARARIETVWNNYKINAKSIKGLSYCYIPHDIDSDEYIKDTAYTYILLGHSATSYGNHIEGLNFLHKWKNENIKIYCPLSYGNMTYRDMVISKGKELFGDKFIPMIDFMEIEKYYAFLNNIDVAVLPITKMAAGTTILYLSAHGKRIYLKREIMKCFDGMAENIYDMDLINEQSFEDFIQKSPYTDNLELNNNLVANAWRLLLED